jgi:hypothetical protein
MLIPDMEDLTISPGWIFLGGGIAGMVTVIRAKTFSWRNYEFLPSEEDRKREVPITMVRRLLLLAVCVGLVLYGLSRIQQDHDWNPFQKSANQPGLLTVHALAVRNLPRSRPFGHPSEKPVTQPCSWLTALRVSQ